MDAKFIKVILICFLGFVFINCAKNATKDCVSTQPACSEKAPTNELCEAAFNRWFYNKASNECEQIGYSGCSAKGFETEIECESCQCN